MLLHQVAKAGIVILKKMLMISAGFVPFPVSVMALCGAGASPLNILEKTLNLGLSNDVRGR